MKSDADASFLLLGETGVGKNVMANYIHNETPGRCNNNFEEVFSVREDNLWESELFGHKEGSFTGAIKDYNGAIARAKGGTLFLDEIGDISYQSQTKLLKFTNDWTYKPIGGDDYIDANVRIISATNKTLEYLTDNNYFRNDLYYRIAAEIISIPPLRERADDIIGLGEYFLDEWNQSYETSYVLGEGDISLLIRHSYPGNIRELKSIIWSVARNSFDDFNTACLEKRLEEQNMKIINKPASKNIIKLQPEILTLKYVQQKVEADHIKKVLVSTNFNISRTVIILGINRGTLSSKLKKYNLKDSA